MTINKAREIPSNIKWSLENINYINTGVQNQTSLTPSESNTLFTSNC